MRVATEPMPACCVTYTKQLDATCVNLTASTFLASDLGGDNGVVPLKSIAVMAQHILRREKLGEWGVPFTLHNDCVACVGIEASVSVLGRTSPTLGPTCASASLADPWQIVTNLSHHRPPPEKFEFKQPKYNVEQYKWEIEQHRDSKLKISPNLTNIKPT